MNILKLSLLTLCIFPSLVLAAPQDGVGSNCNLILSEQKSLSISNGDGAGLTLGYLSNVGRIYPSPDGKKLVVTDRWNFQELMQGHIDRKGVMHEFWSQFGEGKALSSKWVLVDLETQERIPLNVEVPDQDRASIPQQTENRVLYFKDSIWVHLYSETYEATYSFDYYGNLLAPPRIRRNQVDPSIVVFENEDRLIVLSEDESQWKVFDLNLNELGQIPNLGQWYLRPFDDKHFVSFDNRFEKMSIVGLDGEVAREVYVNGIETSFLQNPMRYYFGSPEGKYFTGHFWRLPWKNAILAEIRTGRRGDYWLAEIGLSGKTPVVNSRSSELEMSSDRIRFGTVRSLPTRLGQTVLQRNTIKLNVDPEKKRVTIMNYPNRNSELVVISDTQGKREVLKVPMEDYWQLFDTRNDQFVLIGSHGPDKNDESVPLKVLDSKGKTILETRIPHEEAWSFTGDNVYFRIDENRFTIQREGGTNAYEIDVKNQKVKVRSAQILDYNESVGLQLATLKQDYSVFTFADATDLQLRNLAGDILVDFDRERINVASNAITFLNSNSMLVRFRGERQQIKYFKWGSENGRHHSQEQR